MLILKKKLSIIAILMTLVLSLIPAAPVKANIQSTPVPELEYIILFFSPDLYNDGAFDDNDRGIWNWDRSTTLDFSLELQQADGTFGAPKKLILKEVGTFESYNMIPGTYRLKLLAVNTIGSDSDSWGFSGISETIMGGGGDFAPGQGPLTSKSYIFTLDTNYVTATLALYSPSLDKIAEFNDLRESANQINLDKYTLESVQPLIDILAISNKMRAMEGYFTIDEAARVTGLLKDAIKGLKEKPIVVPVVDTTKLKAAIDKANKIDKDKYTPVSVKPLTDAVKAANDLLDSHNYTDKKIIDATKAIEDAIKGLKTPQITELPDTGTSDNSALPFIGLGLLLLGAYLYAINCKKSKIS